MSDRIVQVTIDKSGLVTIRLLGWSRKDLLRLGTSLLIDRESEKIGRALSARLDKGEGVMPDTDHLPNHLDRITS